MFKKKRNGQSKAFAPVRYLKACLYHPGFCGGLIRFLSACPLSFPRCHQVSQGLSRLMKDSGIWIFEYWISKTGDGNESFLAPTGNSGCQKTDVLMLHHRENLSVKHRSTSLKLDVSLETSTKKNKRSKKYHIFISWVFFFVPGFTWHFECTWWRCDSWLCSFCFLQNLQTNEQRR